MNKIVTMDDIIPIMREQIESGGKVSFTPKGNSMLPMLRNNMDSVTIAKAQLPLKKYELPLYIRENGKYILHRVVAVRDGSYTMCGDNQFIREHGVCDEQIVGVVTEFTRKGKTKKVTSCGYKFYCIFWSKTFFIRKCYRRIRRVLGRIKGKILN